MTALPMAAVNRIIGQDTGIMFIACSSPRKIITSFYERAVQNTQTKLLSSHLTLKYYFSYEFKAAKSVRGLCF